MTPEEYKSAFIEKLKEASGEDYKYSTIHAYCDVQYLIKNSQVNTDLSEQERHHLAMAAWELMEDLIHYEMGDAGPTLLDSISFEILASRDTTGILARLDIHPFFLRPENSDVHGCTRLVIEQQGLTH